MENWYEVIVIGGSYAGLSAAMALGRSSGATLIIDAGQPCNRQTPHSHNFLTQDGETPAQMAQIARVQIAFYPTIQFADDKAVHSKKIEKGFAVTTEKGQTFMARKLLFATGVKDVMPAIPGFTNCWGISVLHCPYCHGYEVKDKPLGVLSNGDAGFEFSKLISQWTQNLTLFTNGKSTLTAEQTAKLTKHNVAVIEKEIGSFEHQNGYLNNIVFTDGSYHPLSAIFSRVPFEQHCTLPQQLGCQLTDQGYIQVNDFKNTTVPDVYAAGDNTTLFRSVSAAVASGSIAGSMINKELIVDEWL